MHGPKWPFLLILIVYGPGVVVVNCWDRFYTLGRAPHTKETLPDFHEWCRVTRHPRIFYGLTGCQLTPGKWGVTVYVENSKKKDKVREAKSKVAWKKRSIFFDLEYWEFLHVRHVLDGMHIEKNVCESILGTLLDIPGKSKDGLSSHLDLVNLGI